jgi:hypothetical protein
MGSKINGDEFESVWITEWFKHQDIRGSITAVGRGGIHGGVLHNVLMVGIWPNFATNH